MMFVETTTHTLNTPNKIAFSVLAFSLLLGIIGCVIQCTTIGNDPDFDPALIAKANEFRSSLQYEAVSIQKKKPWTHYFLAFSLARNTNKLNIESQA